VGGGLGNGEGGVGERGQDGGRGGGLVTEHLEERADRAGTVASEVRQEVPFRGAHALGRAWRREVDGDLPVRFVDRREEREDLAAHRPSPGTDFGTYCDFE